LSGSGEKQQTVLTFLRSAGGERKRECNEWARKLKNLITPPSKETEVSPVLKPERPVLAKSDVSESAQTVPGGTRPAKKKIEIVRPLGTIIEKSPVAPQPVETSSLPSGTFCSRCGNRVPHKSPFCNYCGTPIINVPAPAVQQPVVTRDQVPVPPLTSQPVIPRVISGTEPVATSPVVPKVQVPPLVTPPTDIPRILPEPEPLAPFPVVPKIPIPVPPAAGSEPEPAGSPINQIIHSIEPLIEDSVPRTQTAPVFKKPLPEHTPKPVITEVLAESPPQVVWPVLPSSGSPLEPARADTPAEPESPPQPPSPAPGGKKPNYLAIGIIIIAILPIIAGIVIVANMMAAPYGSSATTPVMTTVVTTISTPRPQLTLTPEETTTLAPGQTQLMIPPSGVWVRASYSGTYIGLIGTPGNQIEVTGTGDKFYPISTSDGIVAAVLQKKDGSGDKIILEIYKNGVMVKRETTTTPKGIVEIQIDLRSLPATGNPTSK
jgi:hypothetical protein